jgi:hypothetical protein
VAKVEWHPGELYPRVAFIVTTLARSAEGVVAFYNRRGRCEPCTVQVGLSLLLGQPQRPAIAMTLLCPATFSVPDAQLMRPL